MIQILFASWFGMPCLSQSFCTLLPGWSSDHLLIQSSQTLPGTDLLLIATKANFLIFPFSAQAGCMSHFYLCPIQCCSHTLCSPPCTTGVCPQLCSHFLHGVFLWLRFPLGTLHSALCSTYTSKYSFTPSSFLAELSAHLIDSNGDKK